MLEHPEIGWIEETGYPSWVKESSESEYDEDKLYEERRDVERFMDD